MKKAIFLIGVCLLSQNISIAAEDVGYNSGVTMPLFVPQSGAASSLSKSIYYSNTVVSVAEKDELPPPMPKIKVPTRRLERTSVTVQNNNVPKEQLDKSSIQSGNVGALNDNLAKSVVVQQQATLKETQVNKNSISNSAKNIQQLPTKNVANKSTSSVTQKPVTSSLTSSVVNPVKQQSYSNQELPPPMPKIKLPIKKYLGTGDVEKSFDDLQDANHLQNQVQKPVLRSKVNKDKTPSDKQNGHNVQVKLTKIEFPESKIFTQEELQQLVAPLLGEPVSLEDIKKVVNDITRCYILGNYPTSKAYLPPQTVKDGVLKIGLLEGTIGKVKVEGNRWTRTSYIEKRINPDEGEVLNIGDIEKEVIKFNNNNAVKVRVGLSAGEHQGETDVTLRAEESYPFHIAFMTDNQGRKAVGTGRFGTMLSHDSLFGFRDRLAIGGYLGHGNRVGFADYNIPVGHRGTRLGVSASAGNISVVNGPMRQFGVGGTSQVYSVYVTHPWYDTEGANISSYSSVNFKKSTSDIMGYKYYDRGTFSLTQGLTAKKDTDKGIWYTGHFGSVGMDALSGDTDFFKYEGNVTRLHDFGKGIVGQFRVSGQFSPNDDLPWMEQFQIGGLSTVRGYSEGLLLGKSGYFASAEIITPLPILPKRVGSDKLGYIYPREIIKGAVFMDNGMIFPYKADGSSIDGGEFLMSWGLGLRINLSRDLAARLYWGYGLKNRYDQDYKLGRFHFDITCAPDIGRLVADRKPAKKDNEKENNEDL